MRRGKRAGPVNVENCLLGPSQATPSESLSEYQLLAAQSARRGAETKAELATAFSILSELCLKRLSSVPGQHSLSMVARHGIWVLSMLRWPLHSGHCDGCGCTNSALVLFKSFESSRDYQKGR